MGRSAGSAPWPARGGEPLPQRADQQCAGPGRHLRQVHGCRRGRGRSPAAAQRVPEGRRPDHGGTDLRDPAACAALWGGAADHRADEESAEELDRPEGWRAGFAEGSLLRHPRGQEPRRLARQCVRQARGQDLGHDAGQHVQSEQPGRIQHLPAALRWRQPDQAAVAHVHRCRDAGHRHVHAAGR